MNDQHKTEPNGSAIREATAAELEWLQHDPDPQRLSDLARSEIEEALTATSRPRDWAPVDIDDAHLR